MDEAAAFIGVGLSLFLRMVGDGRMPGPRRADGRRIWDADEVAIAFRRLPRDLAAGAEVAEEPEVRLWK